MARIPHLPDAWTPHTRWLFFNIPTAGVVPCVSHLSQQLIQATGSQFLISRQGQRSRTTGDKKIAFIQSAYNLQPREKSLMTCKLLPLLTQRAFLQEILTLTGLTKLIFMSKQKKSLCFHMGIIIRNKLSSKCDKTPHCNIKMIEVRGHTMFPNAVKIQTNPGPAFRALPKPLALDGVTDPNAHLSSLCQPCAI